MRKIQFFAVSCIAMVLGVSSCNDLYDESVGYSTSIGNTIEVNAMIGSGALTKAAPESSETTTANLTGLNIQAWKDGVSDAVIAATTATVSGGTATLAGGPYYWPEGTVKFAAYAYNGKSVGNDSLPQISDNIITKLYNVRGLEQGDPVLAYVPASKPQDANSINLVFQHLLSRVSVTVCAPYFTQNYVRVLSFGFKSVDTLATFTYKCGADTTKTAFADTVWSNKTEGFVGVINSTAWYTKGAAPDTASAPSPTAWASGNGPVVPQVMGSTTERLSYTDGSNTVTLPWLNVIPGTNVADSLIMTYEFFNPKYDNGTGKTAGGWETRTARVLIGAGLIPTKNLSNNEAYNPGYQYVYNVRILGQETDDASVTQAQISVESVAVTVWTSEATGEIKTDDGLGTGSSLKTIVEGAPAYSTVTLQKDVDLEDCGPISVTKDLTVDLNDHTITADSTGVIFRVAAGVKFVVKGGTLTSDEIVQVNNVKVNKASLRSKHIKRSGAKVVKDTAGVICVGVGATLTVGVGDDAVAINNTKAKNSCIYVTADPNGSIATKVIINNGTFTTSASDTRAITKSVDNDVTAVEVSQGGTAEFEEEGQTVIPSDVVDYKDAVTVSDYAGLIAAVEGEATHIKLGADITEIDTTIVIGKDFIIDLNSHVITAISKRAIHQTEGTLTLTGSGSVAASGVEPFSQSGTSYKDAHNFSRGSSVIRVGSNSTAAAGIVVGKNVSVTSNFCMGISYFGNGSLNVVVNGTVSSEKSSALCGNGKCTAGANVTINNGAVITASGTGDHTAAGIYQPQAGTLTINGGTITGATGVYVKSGTVTTSITGGTVTGNGVKTAYSATKDGYNPTGDALVLDNCGYPSGAPTADIQGGTFISNNASAVASYADSGETAVSNFISGGTFSDLNAAKYVKEGATIKLYAGVTLSSRYDLDTNRTYIIDLNGNTITTAASCGNGSAFNVKAGAVTIQNGTIDAGFGEATSGETDAITVRNGATAELKNLTITVNSRSGACAYAFEGGAISILSGTYTNGTTEAYQYREGWQGLVVNQANVDTKLISITAGTFNGQSPADGDDSWSAATNTTNGGFIATGSTCTGADRVWTVTASAQD